MSAPGRDYALEEPGFYVPLKGILLRVATTMNITPEDAGEIVQTGMLSGEIAWREVRQPAQKSNSVVRGPRSVEVIGRDRIMRRIDWREGRWTDPDRELEVFWPDVVRATGSSATSMTIDGHLSDATRKPLRIGGSPPTKKGGRPPKYDWPGLAAALAGKLYDDGCPQSGTGEQAALERWAAAFFPPDQQPAESQIREHVGKAVSARREADGRA